MSSIRIPPTLRNATGGQKFVDIGGATVGEVVHGLIAGYPALREQLLDVDGQVNRFINIFLNDTDIRHLSGLETPVLDRDAVVLLPAMAGG